MNMGPSCCSWEITTIITTDIDHATRPHLVAVPTVEQASAEERTDHVPRRRSDEDQADPAVVGADPIAQMRERRPRHAERASEHDETDEIDPDRGQLVFLLWHDDDRRGHH